MVLGQPQESEWLIYLRVPEVGYTVKATMIQIGQDLLNTIGRTAKDY